jgi:hypothetical protein
MDTSHNTITFQELFGLRRVLHGATRFDRSFQQPPRQLARMEFRASSRSPLSRNETADRSLYIQSIRR